MGIAINEEIPLEMKIVCDVDHLWSFTHENFWLDTVRKGVAPDVYVQNLAQDLDGYFVTEEGKRKARQLLQDRLTEIEQWKKVKQQELLIKIVNAWNINEIPEYRGFRCANCQNYINRAWYHWLNSENFILPLHFCNQCHNKLEKNEIVLDENKIKAFNILNLKNKYKEETKKHFSKIISKWPKDKEPVLQNFMCDECEGDLDIDLEDNLVKGFHVWYKMNNGKTLAELHFHRNCALKNGVSD